MNLTTQAAYRACGPLCTLPAGAPTYRAAAIVATGWRSGVPSYLGVPLAGCRRCVVRHVRERLEALDHRAGSSSGLVRWHRQPFTPEEISRSFGAREGLVYVPAGVDRYWVGLNGGLEKEISFEQPHTVNVVYGEGIDTFESGLIEKLPKQPGVYFIYMKGKGRDVLSYVGKAQDIRKRFHDRIGAFKEFGVSQSEYDAFLRRTRLAWALVSLETARMVGKKSYADGVRRGGKAVENASAAALFVAERYFIRTLKPKKNSGSEAIKFEGSGAVTLRIRKGANTLTRGPFNVRNGFV